MTIERLQTNARMSRIVKHNGIIYLCGQVCADAEKILKSKLKLCSIK